MKGNLTFRRTDQGYGTFSTKNTSKNLNSITELSNDIRRNRNFLPRYVQLRTNFSQLL